MKTTHNRTDVRRGVILSMELVLVLPIFLLLIFAIVEFSMLMSARTRAGDAARNASRKLSISGAPSEVIQRTVFDTLGPRLAVNCSVEIQPALKAGDICNVQVRIPMNSVSPDLLWMTGFSLQGRYLQADAPMIMEHAVQSNDMQRL